MIARAGSPRAALTPALVGVGVVAAALAAVASASGADTATRAGLCVVQAVALALLTRAELSGGRGWATASFVVGAAWAALFTVPSIAYTADPGLFDVPDLTGTLAVVTAATVALLGGYAAFAREGDREPVPAATVTVTAATVRPAWAIAGYALGLLALCALAAKAGGPAAYLRSLNQTALSTSGLFYVIAVVLLLRWVPAAVIAQRWGSGERAGRWAIAGYALGTVLLGLTGARAFVAVAAVEIALLWTLLRTPVPTRRVLTVGLVAGAVLVFGVGTVKRYQSSQSIPGAVHQSFGAYATKTAPGELLPAYVNNYVDTVRLMGLARATVPHQAPYEGIRPLKEMALKVVPSQVRPELHRSRTVQAVFSPAGEGMYAVPILANGFLAGGTLVVLAVAVLLGALLRAVDVRVLRTASLPAWQLLTLLAVVVQLPMAIRSGIPNGVALFATEVLGAALAARLVVRTRPAAHVAAAPDRRPLSSTALVAVPTQGPSA